MSLFSISNLSPFLIFILGLLCVPFVECLKDYYNKKTILKHFKVELNDEIDVLGYGILKSSQVLINLRLLRDGKEPNPGPGYFVARNASLLFLSEVQNTNYASLSRRQRNMLKAFSVQLSAINNSMEKIEGKSTDIANEKYDELIIHYQKYLYTSCCLRSCMKKFLSNDDVVSDEQCISSELLDIKCDITYGDILLTRKVMLDC